MEEILCLVKNFFNIRQYFRKTHRIIFITFSFRTKKFRKSYIMAFRCFCCLVYCTSGFVLSYVAAVINNIFMPWQTFIDIKELWEETYEVEFKTYFLSWVCAEVCVVFLKFVSLFLFLFVVFCFFSVYLIYDVIIYVFSISYGIVNCPAIITFFLQQ